MDPDADPGGQKTYSYGSGCRSAILLFLTFSARVVQRFIINMEEIHIYVFDVNDLIINIFHKFSMIIYG